MISSLSITDRTGADVALMSDDGNLLVTNVQGLRGISAVRSVTRPRPTAHGGINQSHWTDGQLVVIEGEVASNLSYEDALSRWTSFIKPFIETLDYGAATVKWREGTTGNLLQKTVVLNNLIEPVFSGVAPVLPYQVQLYAADPRAYEQTQTVATGASLANSAGGKQYPFTYPYGFTTAPSGGLISVTNNGNRKTPPIIRLYGGVTNPRIALVGTTSLIKLTGVIANGDYVEIDVANRTAKLNGSTDVRYMLDFQNSSWFELPSGSSTLQAYADAFDGTARADVLYRGAFA